MNYKTWLDQKKQIDQQVWDYLNKHYSNFELQDYYIDSYNNKGVKVMSISGKLSSLIINWDELNK